MIAITGASGLLGRFILKKFNAENAPVIAFRRATSDLSGLTNLGRPVEWREADITNSLTLIEALNNVETVIHSAALVSFDPREKKKIFQTNVSGTQNVVNACLSLGIPRLIFVSSVAALGRKKGVKEINEENKWEENELNSDYAKSKYLAELEVYRGREEGLSVSIINPSVILATGNPKNSSAQIFNYVQKQRPFYAEGNINFVDVRDVADMIYKIYKTPNPHEKFIANAGSIKLQELLGKIAKRLDKTKPSIKVSPRLIRAMAWLEEMRCTLTGEKMIISRQSVKIPGEEFVYQNQKSINQLNMAYRPLEETLDWCCEYYKNVYTTKK